MTDTDERRERNDETMDETRDDGERTFYRTLPVFDSGDRRVVQSLLHYAVANDGDTPDVAYDHPDRKEARRIYHELQEGEAIRLLVGTDVTGVELVLSYEHHELDVSEVLETFESICEGEGPEWSMIAREIRRYRRDGLSSATTEIGFEYRY